MWKGEEDDVSRQSAVAGSVACLSLWRWLCHYVLTIYERYCSYLLIWLSSCLCGSSRHNKFRAPTGGQDELMTMTSSCDCFFLSFTSVVYLFLTQLGESTVPLSGSVLSWRFQPDSSPHLLLS